MCVSQPPKSIVAPGTVRLPRISPAARRARPRSAWPTCPRRHHGPPASLPLARDREGSVEQRLARYIAASRSRSRHTAPAAWRVTRSQPEPAPAAPANVMPQGEAHGPKARAHGGSPMRADVEPDGLRRRHGRAVLDQVWDRMRALAGRRATAAARSSRARKLVQRAEISGSGEWTSDPDPPAAPWRRNGERAASLGRTEIP